jgi:predicted component of viral defense system (DUF524 family)
VASIREVELSLSPPGLGGTLRLSLLPSEPEASGRLVDLRDHEPSDGLLPVRLAEDSEYVFSAHVPDSADVISFQPTELFSADEPSGRHGRLRTGSYVGVLPIEAYGNGGPIGRATVEVVSRKLNYLDEYRYMLSDLSNEAVALVLERFAPAKQRFFEDWGASPRTVYERFLHIQAVMADPSFTQAVLHVIARPHVEWVEVTERRSPHRPMRPTSQLVRSLVRSGPREDWPGGPVPTLPRSIEVSRTEATVDTIPNRFVRFVVDDFISLLSRMSDVLTAGAPTGPSTRGRIEISALTGSLRALRGQPFFSDVSELDHFPLDNQVVLKQPGYREVLHAYLRVQIGLALAWDGASDLTGAQRDSATLYEYWAFVRLLRTLEDLCDHLPVGSLVTETKEGLTLSLKQGIERRFTGTTTRLGRTIDVDLFYNRRFGRGSDSWTLAMRPDCSIRLQCDKDGKALTPVWLHFDAKYRLSDYGLVAELAPDEAVDPHPEPVRDDLLKMHVYLGAIRRSVGSYVLYPGPPKEGRRYSSYRELLPGIGAFALRPQPGTTSEAQLSEFLDDVLVHLASVTTEDRRYRYWEAVAHDRQTELVRPFGWEPLEGVPPADTPVLVGFVRSEGQRRWIYRTGLYNLRADASRKGAIDWVGPEVKAEVLVMYDTSGVIDVWKLTGAAEVQTASQLLESGYPQPGGQTYICLKLSERLHPPATASLGAEDVTAFATKHGRAFGAPVLTTWAELVGIASSHE